MKTKIRSPACVTSDSRCPPVNASHVRLGHGWSDATEVVTVNQVNIAIFAQGQHEFRRRSARHIDNSRTHTTQIAVAVIKREPVSGRAVVGRHTGPGRTCLQPDNGFTSAPHTSRVERVTSNYKHISPIAGNAAVSPNATADSCCRPRMHIRRIVNIHADNPTMIHSAVAVVSGISHVHDPVHKSQSTPFFLHQRGKVMPL
jgi:hypothetical protein